MNLMMHGVNIGNHIYVFHDFPYEYNLNEVFWKCEVSIILLLRLIKVRHFPALYILFEAIETNRKGHELLY